MVCLGESMAQLAPDPPAPLGERPRLRLDTAGAEANVATWLAMLSGASGAGHRVAWRGRVGADSFGELVIGQLAAAGVDTSLVEIDPQAPTGLYVKDPAPGGSTRVHYYRRGSAASHMDRRMLDGLTGARLVHLSGITAALSGSCADLVRHALVDRPVAGALMSFDVNHRPGLWPASRAGPVLAELAAAADLVFVGRDEAQALWGATTAEEVREVLPGPATLVVKDGAGPATAFHGAQQYAVPALAVRVVEPVGAGDAFAAGYLWGVICNAAPVARLRLGHLLAGQALRVASDIGAVPPANEVREAIGEDG